MKKYKVTDLNPKNVCIVPLCKNKISEISTRYCQKHLIDLEGMTEDKLLKLLLLIRKLYMSIAIDCYPCEATKGVSLKEMRIICAHCADAILDEAEEVLRAAGMIKEKS